MRGIFCVCATAFLGDYFVDRRATPAATGSGATRTCYLAARDRSALYRGPHFTFPDSVALTDDHRLPTHIYAGLILKINVKVGAGVEFVQVAAREGP